MSDIPVTHPRYKSLVIRKQLADYALAGVVSLEGLTSHGRGEAFDYLIGEKTPAAALEAEKLAARILLAAKHPVLSINGNTAALAAAEIADLQKAAGCEVEVNLFHRTEERIQKVTDVLTKAGVTVSTGPVERCVPLPHDRGLCRPDGIGSADVVRSSSPLTSTRLTAPPRPQPFRSSTRSPVPSPTSPPSAEESKPLARPRRCPPPLTESTSSKEQ